MDKKMRKIKYRTSAKHVDTTINGLKLDDIDKYFKIKSTLQTTKTNVEQINSMIAVPIKTRFENGILILCLLYLSTLVI